MNYKNINKSCVYFAAIILTLVGFSCKKSLDESLDVIPGNSLTNASVWSSSSTADVFLNTIYGYLPDGNNQYDPFDNWSDNSICGYAWPVSRTEAQQATFTPSTLNFDQMPYTWNTLYRNVRACNVFITNVTSSSLDTGYKKIRIAEARFLRAFFYQELWMTYGGVPIITSPLDISTQGDSIFRARNTSDETFQFIDSELGAIAGDLPAKSKESGRATMGAALALKGWVELFNHKFEASAATNMQVINMGVYSLFPDFGQLFMPGNNVNNEGIFYREYIPNVLGGRCDSYDGTTFTKGGSETSWGGVNPTQELVDDYDMDNGKPITDPASGYNPQKPYLNREPRFYESIVYDGSWWYNDTIYTRIGIGSPNEIDLSDHNDATQTGYYQKKGLNDKITLGADNWNNGTSGQNYYYFRYADVLLNYAEAQNEASGPDASVYDAINQVRERAKIPDLPLGLSQEAMRTAIRRERRVEFAFEGKRYWDLIRWQIAGTNINQQLHGISITNNSGVLNYTTVTVPGGDRKFDASKNYLFPIPQSAIDQNKNLEQNPGY
jgi:hypothetical protein